MGVGDRESGPEGLEGKSMEPDRTMVDPGGGEATAGSLTDVVAGDHSLCTSYGASAERDSDLEWPQVDLFRRTITILEQKNGSKDTLPLNATALDVVKGR